MSGNPAYQARQPRAAKTGVQIEPRDGVWVAEATGLIDLAGWPTGTRLILRKERPHPGAQLCTTDADGMRVPPGPACPADPRPARLVRHAGALTLRLPPGYHLLEEVLTRIRALPTTS